MRSLLALGLALLLTGCGGGKDNGGNDLAMNPDVDGFLENSDLAGADLGGADLAGNLPAPGCSTACSIGAKSCDGNGVRTCQAKGNCSEWSAPVPCGGGGGCSGGECVGTCKNQCDVGATYCSQNGFRICASQLGGCTDWSTVVTACQNGAVCSGGACTDHCVDRCTPGETICAGFGVQKCERKFSGCLDWSDPFPCDTGKVCSGGQCVATCSDQCTAGMSACDGADSLKACEKQASGCNDFSLPQLCGSGVCSGNACQTCTESTKRCSALGNVEQCTMGAFTEITSCAFGCSGGMCTTMVSCNPGEQHCNGNSVEVCNSTGTAFLFSSNCPNGCSGGLCQGTCTENALRCNLNTVEKCTSGMFVAQTTCTTFCDSGQCALDSLDIATTMDLNGLVVVKGAVTIDGTGNLTSTSGNLTIRADSIHVTGKITITPTGMTADGKASDCGSSNGLGGGGGSYGAQGTGSCGIHGSWGTFFDSDVQPGSPGGAGGTEFGTAGSGGAGGGVLKLIANSITVDSGAQIFVDGATGGTTTSGSGCGGGGAGGGILIAGDQVNVAGLISAGGGNGGTGGSCVTGGKGGAGRIKILHGSTSTITTSNFTTGAFDTNLGTTNDNDLIPPLLITSSTHPDQTLFYNDGAPNLGLTWAHPFSSAMGFYQVLNTIAPSSLSASNLPQPPAAGDLVRQDLISLDPKNLQATTNFFHIVSVNSTAVIGQVDSHYSIQVNSTAPQIMSKSHGSQQTFSTTHDVFWSWMMQAPANDDKNYSGIYYVVDGFGDSIPTTAGTFVPISTKQIIKNLPDGVWAFHVVSADTMGYLTKEASHYAVRIGTPATTMGTIQGSVVDNNNIPKPGVTMTINRGILDLGGSPTSVVSDGMGKFGFSNIPSGSWEVEANITGFKQGTASATVTDITPQVVSITLQPSP